MIDFGGISLPFNVGDLLSSAMGLFGVVGSFALLVLSIAFAPKIIFLVKDAVRMGNRAERL